MKTLHTASKRANVSLGKVIALLEADTTKQESKLRALRDPDRQAKVQDYFASQVRSQCDLLNMLMHERIAEPKAGVRSQSGGSSAPWSMLAVHLALVATNAECGNSGMFPFVVDTPAQSGQDDTNLAKMQVASTATTVSARSTVRITTPARPDALPLPTTNGQRRRWGFRSPHDSH